MIGWLNKEHLKQFVSILQGNRAHKTSTEQFFRWHKVNYMYFLHSSYKDMVLMSQQYDTIWLQFYYNQANRGNISLYFIYITVVRCYSIQWYDYRSFLPRPFFSLRMRKYKFKGYERLSLLEQVMFILRVSLCFLLWIPASIFLHFPHVPLNKDRNPIFFNLTFR